MLFGCSNLKEWDGGYLIRMGGEVYTEFWWGNLREKDHLEDPGIEENNPYPTAFPYGNGMVLHFYQQQESSTTKTVHKVINKGLKTYV